MKELKGNILYFQSGGPTCVINSTFTGLYNEYKKHNMDNRFYVSHYGINGLLNDDLFIIKENNFNLDYCPGSYFGSARIKLPSDKSDTLAVKIIEQIKKYDIHYIFVNGGNDSMDSALKLANYFQYDSYNCQIIGLLKTIDNDLNITDHTPGFASAAKYIINCVIAVKKDDLSYQEGRVNIIEVMGRDNGSLASSSIVASLKNCPPDFIYVPEVSFDVNKFIYDVTSFYKKNKHCLVVVSEGIKDKDNNLISTLKSKDQFGNSQLGGVSHYLASLISKEGIKNRAIELSLIQRASSFIPSQVDINESKKSGAYAFKAILNGESNKAVVIKRLSNNPYKIKFELTSLKNVATKAVPMPNKYITKEGNNIKQSYIDYVLPLLKGEGKQFDKQGLLNI